MGDVPLKEKIYRHIYISVKAEKENNKPGYLSLCGWPLLMDFLTVTPRPGSSRSLVFTTAL